MPNKTFLESYPLYKRLKVSLAYPGDLLANVGKPAINMYCEVCKSVQTFNMVNDYWENEANNKLEASNIGVWGLSVRAKYECSACGKAGHIFFIEFVEEKNEKDPSHPVGFIRKIGQTPPWSIDMDKKVELLIGKNSEFYKNGLACESQGYGIGAYAYYRRVIEGTIDSLLQSIEGLIEGHDNKQKYQEALEKVKQQRITEEKIKLVQDLLPPSLKTDTLNPLKIIHSSLSEGLHSKSDEECLELAENIKKSLIFLVSQVLANKESKKEFTESLKSLLEKK